MLPINPYIAKMYNFKGFLNLGRAYIRVWLDKHLCLQRQIIAFLSMETY